MVGEPVGLALCNTSECSLQNHLCNLTSPLEDLTGLMFPIENFSNGLKPFFIITGGGRIGPRRTICDQKHFGDCIRASTTSFRYWRVLIPMACSATNMCSDTS